MLGNLLKTINNRTKCKYIEKLKPLILDCLYHEQKGNFNSIIYADRFSFDKKIKQYQEYDFSLIQIALKELESEEKIIVNCNETPNSFSLTKETFKSLSENRHPIKSWIKINIFHILNLILGLWGSITGTLALFF